MAEPTPPLEPNCDYNFDPNFPIVCDVDYSSAYCCLSDIGSGNGFVVCEDGVGCLAGSLIPGQPYMTFPIFNDQNQPMLKTALGGTTMSAWVKVAFQQYCGSDEDPIRTAHTIITMGNVSQPCNDEKCKAIIKAFQYGWGAINQGNRCRITIMDQKGSEFQSWVQRMGINPEADATPVQGKFRMKVQWGWYVTGGADEDICGQPPQPIAVPSCDEFNDPNQGQFPIVPPDPGFNSAFIICSPVLYFLVDWINVHWDQGKFVYELEGVDTLVRGQENMIEQIFGKDGEQMYFTKAVELLGLISFPQFRVEFKAITAGGDVVDMVFAPADTNTQIRLTRDENVDCKGYGPLKVFRPNTKPPLAVIQDWIAQGVFAQDLTGKVTSNGGRVGMTMNFDPTYKFTPVGSPNASTDDPCAICKNSGGDGQPPQYGRLVIWANGIPYCQGNLTDDELNKRMKAVYIVNGGNCSPVLSFTPSFRWHSWAAQRNAGASTPANSGQENVQVDQPQGFVKVNCPIASTRGHIRQEGVAATQEVQKTLIPALQAQESMFHSIMTNLMIGAIEADLRVQGDPSSWLCTPVDGYGRCVGIIFINPYFLIEDPNSSVKGCPQWFANDALGPDDPFSASTINKLLTNKGWYVVGADHQIKDGQYITTLKLRLLAPGAELNQAGSITNLGGWAITGPNEGGVPVVYGGRFGCLTRYLLGNQGVSWGNEGNREICGLWVGGGTACSPNYIFVPPSELPPECAECDS
jgi:hypothetical protein